jgi:hypothetical protein
MPPFRTVPATVAFAQAAESNGPNRSLAPLSVLPLWTSCTLPRQFSSEPVPDEDTPVRVAVGAAFLSALVIIQFRIPAGVTFGVSGSAAPPHR